MAVAWTEWRRGAQWRVLMMPEPRGCAIHIRVWQLLHEEGGLG
jgi:hypothetical protein